MSTVDGYAPGIPCWVDLMASDASGAAEFYSSLFGWNCVAGGDDVGGYIMADIGGLPVAGIGQKPADAPFPAMWTTYVSTADVDATLAAVVAAGGTPMMPAMDVVNGDNRLGRLAAFADPTGAVIGVWQAGDHHGALRVNEPGALTWNELMTRDPEAAKGFFADVFDWTYQPMDMGGSEYNIVHVDSGNADGVGGIMPMPAEVPDMVPNYWVVYFAVDDTDATVEAALAQGASLVYPAMDIAPGRTAGLADPQGANFAILGPRT